MNNELKQNRMCDEAVGLLMTYRCNLNCKYCYISPKRNKDMTLGMAQSILEPFLLKNGGLVDIIFMGGETLLAIDVLRALVEWIEGKKWNREYRFFGTTNGTLLNDNLKMWLTRHSHLLTLCLSYDGLPSAQRNNRCPDDIDIDFFIKTWPKQPIQMTINEETVDKMADGVIFLLEKGAVVHPNVAYEEREWSEESLIEYGKQLNKLIYYYNAHEGLPIISQFKHNLNEYAKCIEKHKPQTEMCGSGNGFQLFDIDGTEYPCHMLSPLVFGGEKLEAIKNGLVSSIKDFSDDNCSECPYTSSCPTCIACNYLYRNRIQKRDKTHCRIIKLEVKPKIKMEVMRLKAKEQLTSDDATLIDSIKKLDEFERKHLPLSY